MEIEGSTRNMVTLATEPGDASENHSDNPPGDDVHGSTGADPEYHLAFDESGRWRISQLPSTPFLPYECVI